MHPDKPVRAIALMNQKGGVGKTTTSVHLAHALARAGRPTLLIDLDPQAHASLHLGIEPADNRPTVYDVLTRDALADDAIVGRDEHLAVLPAETDLAAVESELQPATDRNQRLIQALAPVSDRYEFIVLDCPPSLGLLTLNGLAAAREVLIPMQAHFLALQGVSKLLETVRLVQARLNDRLRVLGVVLCMHEANTTLAQEVVADLRAFFEAARGTAEPWAKARLLSPAIRRNVKLAESPSFGQTIFEYAPQAAGAHDYEALAAALLLEWDEMLHRRAEREAEPPIVETPPTTHTNAHAPTSPTTHTNAHAPSQPHG